MDFNDLCSFYFNVREQRCIEMSLEESRDPMEIDPLSSEY